MDFLSSASEAVSTLQEGVSEMTLDTKVSCLWKTVLSSFPAFFVFFEEVGGDGGIYLVQDMMSMIIDCALSIYTRLV